MTLSRCLAALALAIALAPSSTAQAQALELAAPAPQVHWVHHADRGLVEAGATMLSIGWGLNTIGALAGELAIEVESSPNDFDLRYGLSFIPIAGPLTLTGFALDANADALWFVAAFALADAAVQAVGLGLLIAGLVGVDEPITEVAEGVSITPVASSSSAGAMMQVQW